jgi:hypothetical protein
MGMAGLAASVRLAGSLHAEEVFEEKLYGQCFFEFRYARSSGSAILS